MSAENFKDNKGLIRSRKSKKTDNTMNKKKEEKNKQSSTKH